MQSTPICPPGPEEPPPYTKDICHAPPGYYLDRAQKELNALTDVQKAALSIGILRAAASDKADAEFKKASDDASTAVRNIDEMFKDLTKRLNRISGAKAKEFSNRFTKLHKEFRKVVEDSYDLAIKTAIYAEDFDEVIVDFCADKTLTVERRKEKIKDFIKEADDIEKMAKDMEKRFEALKGDFSQFVKDFKEWAEDPAKELRAELVELDADLAKINSAMDILQQTLIVTLGITGTLAILFPPAAPFILATGNALAAVQLGAYVVLATEKTSLTIKRIKKQAEIKELQKNMTDIKATCAALDSAEKGTNNASFATNIEVLQKVWQNVKKDAEEIKAWLEKGEKVADIPKYMKEYLDKAVRVYKKMGTYLRDYAKGVEKVW